MGGSVLSQGNAVVGENIDHMQPHQRRETHRRPHVIGENQKCCAEGQNAAMRRQAIQDRPHGMLAYTKIEIAAGVAPDALCRALLIAPLHSAWLKISQSRKCGKGRWIQIRRAAVQCRQSRCNGIHHPSPRDARRKALCIRGEDGISRSHPSGNSPRMTC